MSGLKPKDLRSLRTLFEKTGGKVWEPPAPRFPWIMRMIEAGYLRRVTMRCGFEAMKDAGLAFTDAGRRVVEASLLTDELIAKESSQTFYGINSVLLGKLRTIRATLGPES